jgi:argininosuccinate lyase
MANLWAGRFAKGLEDIVEKFNASISFDQKMYASDIRGSTAHVTMLAKQGIISPQERDAIVAALEKIRQRIAAGEVTFTTKDEDIHMAVEGLLIKELGDTGKKLHTARSRNDQCAVDTKLYLRERVRGILETLVHLLDVLLKKADQYADSLMIGFTHVQHAQPVTVGFHFMAYFQMFRRDLDRLLDATRRMNQCPLGACALAGTTFPIDRHMTAGLLGFAAPTENAMDSVSDRDYIIEFLAVASISLMHISRMAEEFVWWNSQEFSFIDIDDSYCTGSSIMPQKKNPDMAELLRGKGCRVTGSLMQMLALLKGTPLSYNKDFQEDKEGLFDAIETWEASLRILAGMIEKTEFRLDMIASHMGKGFLTATDIAENFARQGIPFREAHELVGKMVKFCEGLGKDFADLTPEELIKVDPRLTPDRLPDLSIAGCVNARKSFGGTAPEEVRRQIGVGRDWLGATENAVREIE